jgi:glycosyltransferase involved in cell wall biosynthesis
VLGLVMLTLAPGESGGSETYARGLARALARRARVNVTAFVPPLAPDAGEGLPTIVVGRYGSPIGIPARLAAMARAALRPGLVGHELEAAHFPLTLRLPRVSVPYAMTLHDVQHLDLPQLFSRGERLFRALSYRRSAEGARIVIVPSEFVRGRALALLGLDPERVRVVPWGIDLAGLSPGEEPRETFLLYPARPWPHKNHARLYEAFELLRRARPDLRLVLTGHGDFGRVPDGVDVRGLVSRSELVELYRRAGTLVFPSLYEGFGQPPLEAMACGCPVAAAEAGSLPEVCGDSARLFDPHDPAAIAAAIDEVLAEPAEWSRRGLAHAQRFTWDRAAEAHEAAYAELLG